jgi:glyoxylase-like metal-dependent hydrolase (beta-lactamase superfamily II)
VNPIAIHAYNPGPMTGFGNWTWLVHGSVTTLIDAGVGDPRHLDDVARALDGARLQQVIVTHGHTDHASGSPALAARFPGVRFRKMPWLGRDVEGPQWEPVADGDRLDAGDAGLVAVHTPGHAPDHLCLWHEPSASLFGGDLAIQGTSIFIPTSHGGDLSQYLASVERVIALAPRRIFPAHGPIIEDPATVLRECITHRQEREQQVLQALSGGASTADDVVGRVYPGLKPVMSRFGRDTIVAHLLKLEREGRVRRDADPEAWHIMEP